MLKRRLFCDMCYANEDGVRCDHVDWNEHTTCCFVCNARSPKDPAKNYYCEPCVGMYLRQFSGATVSR